MSKAKKIEIALVDKLMQKTSPLQKRQIRDRIALAMKIDELIKVKFETYTKFANHINRNVAEVSRWVSGTHNITQSTLSEIAMGLDVDLLELFTKKEIHQPLIIEFTAKPYEREVQNHTINVSKFSLIHC